MTQDEFIAARRDDWDALDQLLREAHDRGVRRLSAGQISRLSALYRTLSGDLARAERARFSGELTSALERLAARAHSILYVPPPWRIRALWHFLAQGFPRLLRKRWRYFVFASLLFAVPLAVGLAGALLSSTFAQRVLPASALAQAAESYGQGFGAGRGSGEGAMMTGFYVYNNVGIAFRCFATGIFFGIGSVFFLIYNGVVIGTTLGHVIDLGYGTNILSFIVTHGPFELTAIVISGAAGLQMGTALVSTGGETRLGALRRQGPEIFGLVMGAAAMLVVAALIEGLWSGSSLPVPVKFVAGGLCTVLVTLYLTLAGRRAAGEST